MLVIPVKVSSVSFAGIAGVSVFSFIIFGAMLLMKKDQVRRILPKSNTPVVYFPHQSQGGGKNRDLNNQSEMADNERKNDRPESRANGVVSVNNQLERGHYNMAFTDDLAVQPFMPLRWPGILLHPSQLGFSMNGNQVGPMNMMASQPRAIFLPIGSDMMASSYDVIRGPTQNGDRIHTLSADSKEGHSPGDSFPPVEDVSTRARSRFEDEDEGKSKYRREYQ